MTNLDISISGKLVKIARLRAEGYEFIDDPTTAIRNLRTSGRRVDIFTFTQRLPDREPRFPFEREREPLAVLKIESYDHWWKKVINDKTRNMVRKAAKKGIEIRLVDFDDALVAGIEQIHNEHPLRQGRPFKHYGKPFDRVKQDHISFLDRSDFIGAYFKDELVGIVKLVHQPGWSSLMQIISKISHRDKAPTNALLARAVERCAEKQVPLLQYGIWSRKGIGDFKEHHGFVGIDTVRYYVPLTAAGSLLMRTRLHHNPAGLVPERVLDFAMDMRYRWYSFKYRSFQPTGAVAQSGERHAKA